jgi:hypothetical protein
LEGYYYAALNISVYVAGPVVPSIVMFLGLWNASRALSVFFVWGGIVSKDYS